MIRLERVYDEPEPGGGVRFLVDRLWPRGIRKADLKMDAWLKEVSPSDDLRKRYHNHTDKWEEFEQEYFSELDGKRDAWEPIAAAAKLGTVTLLYSARDTERNNAVALKRYLENKLRG